MNAELEQKRRNVRVMDLLTRSYEAHARGDGDEAERLITEAIETDAAVVSVLRGGMFIGELPRPEADFPAWTEYVAANHEALARLEAELAPCPETSDSQHCEHWHQGETCCACGALGDGSEGEARP